jgi:transposase
LQKNVLKGTRWLLLKNPQNLDEQRNERQRLEEALLLNKPLATAYYLKEDLRQLWEQEGHLEASDFLDDWMARARASGVRMLQEFAQTLEIHRTGLLNWYFCPISTGPLEGTNTKIKLLQRQAYGYRDMEFFRLKIYAIHQTTYALVG